MSDLSPNDPPWHHQLRFVLRDNPADPARQLRLLQVYEQRKDASGEPHLDWYDVPLVEVPPFDKDGN